MNTLAIKNYGSSLKPSPLNRSLKAIGKTAAVPFFVITKPVATNSPNVETKTLSFADEVATKLLNKELKKLTKERAELQQDLAKTFVQTDDNLLILTNKLIAHLTKKITAIREKLCLNPENETQKGRLDDE